MIIHQYAFYANCMDKMLFLTSRWVSAL